MRWKECPSPSHGKRCAWPLRSCRCIRSSSCAWNARKREIRNEIGRSSKETSRHGCRRAGAAAGGDERTNVQIAISVGHGPDRIAEENARAAKRPGAIVDDSAPERKRAVSNGGRKNRG